MFYIIYSKRRIDILKCSACKSYSIELLKTETATHPDWSVFAHSCLGCGKTGNIRISTTVELEEFDSWDKLQERVEELKVITAFKDL